MKRIGLVIATNREYSIIFNDETIKSEIVEEKPFNIHKLSINNKEIYAIKSDIGEINAALATQYLINKYEVELILNYGVVGSLKDNLEVRNVVFVNRIFDYELDISALDGPRGYRKEFDDTYVYPSKELLKKIKPYFQNIPEVTCASGNKFISDEGEKEFLAKEFEADICEMEALGIAIAAHKYNVPTLFVKGVSDSKSGGASEFEKMIIESSECTFKILLKITEIL